MVGFRFDSNTSDISAVSGTVTVNNETVPTLSATPGAPEDGYVLTWDNDTTSFVLVAPAGAGTLDGLTDVVITTPADDEVLAYDNGSGNWINQTAAEAGLAVAGHTHTLDSLSDVNVGTPGVGEDGYSLVWDNGTSQFILANVSGGSGTPAGSDDQIQFNDGGAFGGASEFRYVGGSPASVLLGVTEHGILEGFSSSGAGVAGRNLTVRAGSNNTDGAGGTLTLSAGNANGAARVGGDVIITSGTSDDSTAGVVTITGGTAISGVGGDITITGGQCNEGGAVTIAGGAGHASSVVGDGGAASLAGGQGKSAGGNGGATIVQGGAGGSTTGNGGNLTLAGGTVTSGTAGSVLIQTAGSTRITFEPDGSWNIGGSNGTSGQVLTSNGAGSAPTWQAGGGGGGSLDGLSDVTITSVADNEFLTYDNGTSQWINETRAEADVGYLTVPQNTQDANYALVAADIGKHLLVSSIGAGLGVDLAWTMTDANFPIGSAITIINVYSSSDGFGWVNLVLDTGAFINMTDGIQYLDMWFPPIDPVNSAGPSQGTILKIAAGLWTVAGVGVEAGTPV